MTVEIANVFMLHSHITKHRRMGFYYGKGRKGKKRRYSRTLRAL